MDDEFRKKLAPTYVHSFLYFDSPVNVHEYRKVVKERLCVQSRFTSVLRLQKNDANGRRILPLASVYFDQYDVEELDMEHHVKEMHCKTQGEIVEQMNSIYGGNYLPRDRPPWQFFVCNDMDDGRSVIVGCIDHTIGDGLSLLESLFSMLDDPPTTAQALSKKRASQAQIPFDVRARLFLNGICRFCCTMWFPQLISDIKTVLTMNPVVSTRARCVKDVEKLDLEQVKELKNCFPGATLNDVLCAVMAMCVRKFLEDKNDPITSTTNDLQAGFMVSLRKPCTPVSEHFGNKGSPGRFTLPLHYKDRIDCVWQTKRNIDCFKYSPEAVITYNFMSLGQEWAEDYRLLNSMTATPASSIMLSNVAGPQVPVYLIGQRVTDIMYYSSCSMSPLYLGLMSYNGKIGLNIAADPKLMADPNELGKYWKSEFNELYKEAMAKKGDSSMTMPPWSGRMRCVVSASLLVVAYGTVCGALAYKHTLA